VVWGDPCTATSGIAKVCTNDIVYGTTKGLSYKNR